MVDLSAFDNVTASQLAELEILKYKPNNAKLRDFHRSPAKTRLILGGKRSGKTYANIMETSMAATGCHPYGLYPPPPLQIRYCTVDFNAVHRIAMPYFKKFLYPWAWGDFRKDPPILYLANGTEIEFKSYESDIESFEGVSRHLISMDEEPPLDVYQSNMLRTLDVAGRLIITCTPLHGLTWLYDQLYDNPDAVPPIVEHWHVRTDENPAISQQEIEAVKKNPAMKDNLEAALLGEFIPKSGLVYSAFSDKNMIDPIRITEDFMILLGVDPHDRNPWGVIFVALNRENDYIVFDEILEPGTVEELAPLIKKKLNGRVPQISVMDTSGKIVQTTSGKSVKDQLIAKGIYTTDADKDVSAGVITVNQLLQSGQLKITKNCVNLIRQFRHCIWEDWARNKNQKDPKERILKRDDHLLDALRYVCMEPVVYRHPGYRFNPVTPSRVSPVTGYF